MFTANVADYVSDDDADYSKGAGHETVRYPKSGLVGPTDIEAPANTMRNSRIKNETLSCSTRTSRHG